MKYKTCTALTHYDLIYFASAFFCVNLRCLLKCSDSRYLAPNVNKKATIFKVRCEVILKQDCFLQFASTKSILGMMAVSKIIYREKSVLQFRNSSTFVGRLLKEFVWKSPNNRSNSSKSKAS